LQALDIRTVPSVAKSLCSFLRTGVGLPTRVSSAKSLAYLAEKYPGELGIHAQNAFKSLVDFLVSQHRLDSALRKTVLSTLGTLARVIPEEVLEDICSDMANVFISLFNHSKGTVESFGTTETAGAIACMFTIY
jgi:hypothetical protein